MGSTRERPKVSLAREFEEWLRVIPGDVDATTEMVRQRIGRIARQFERVLADVADDHEMSAGDWEALSVLARSADQGGLTPGRMAAILGLTSGTVSVRLERLMAAGLIERAEGTDKRQRPVRLTAAGRDGWGAATVARTTAESRLMRDCLTGGELDQLSDLLGTLLVRLESAYGPAPRHDMTRGRKARE
ncbi:MAG TPA: MarR family transcriptional regulator [Flexivirga sp.]|uniref:MarR family winged helix-turn-helix transcriptional regulator n=1 Tax=Flexivirga sp. TaxID=1962927 RepID=UPI002B9E630B|nr:MarR family transcriptional regulator [Flexivirga sp.]HWC22480.1 MarR family transcriptional regulator [Flexivirga sp.]